MLDDSLGPGGPFHQSTFFWGCLSVVITIVATVLATMIKDLRWLLIFAWPFAIGAFWEFSRTWTTVRRAKWITIAGTVISGMMIVFLYVILTPSMPPASANNSSESIYPRPKNGRTAKLRRDATQFASQLRRFQAEFSLKDQEIDEQNHDSLVEMMRQGKSQAEINKQGDRRLP